MGDHQATPGGPSEGRYTGFFQYQGMKQRHATRLDLQREGEVLSGQGRDADGAYVIEGLYAPETQNLRWRKRYDHGTVVLYQGRFDAARGVITGRWRVIDSNTHGTFGLAPGRGNKALLDAPVRRTPRSSRSDLRQLQFDGDWQLRAELGADRGFAALAAEASETSDLMAIRRSLMTQAVKLTPRTSPTLHALLDACKARLGISREIELFAYQDPNFGAAISGVDEQRVVLFFSGSLLDRFSDKELMFVIGHELGHAIFEHDLLPPWLIDADPDASLAPVVAMRFFAWMRSAEVSADRAGLVCCEDVDAASSAFFKLASGLVTGEHKIHADAWAEGDLSDEAWELGDAESWFGTHPFIPLRLRALRLYARSKAYARFLGRPVEGLSDAAMEKETRRLLAMMEPSFLHQGGRREKEVREFVALGALAVALSDGKLKAAEKRALEPILKRTRAVGDVDEALASDAAARDRRLWHLGDVISVHLPLARRIRVLEDLAAIARADKRVTEAEALALEGLATNLGLDPSEVEAALGIPEAAMD
ncbi:MAG: M48 family metalloprotease [Myxococcales bacterium]|nr:M48 family metalloprotease [Myxococcales bacterium]